MLHSMTIRLIHVHQLGPSTYDIGSNTNLGSFGVTGVKRSFSLKCYTLSMTLHDHIYSNFNISISFKPSTTFAGSTGNLGSVRGRSLKAGRVRRLWRQQCLVDIAFMFVEELFEVATVVLQGDVLAPFLFITTIDFMMKNAEEGHRSWLCHSHPRTSERDPAKNLQWFRFCWFLFKSKKNVQPQVKANSEAAKEVDLPINKTKSLQRRSNVGWQWN